MKSIQQIEDWIEAIESSNISAKKQEQHIADVVDFWKFATTYDNHISILEKGKVLLNENGFDEEITIATSNLVLSQKRNPFEKIITEVEAALLNFGAKYSGLYSIRFHNLNRNFQEEDLALVKDEILSAIKGEIVFFKYIYKLNKIESTELKIYKNDLGVLQCNSEDIQKQISKTKPEKTEEKQWLILLLDTVDHNCNSFLFESNIKEAVFKSGYDKVFLFDFYKSEIISINVSDGLKNPIRHVKSHIDDVQRPISVVA
ncbi:hypothetical protein ACFPVY_11135 [Flavobacterium qiangtangense]|uniref:PH domain-containing protein n=1 Tax=Flavobacterium qiangtangense TaxID=1442595 RepID=A0ABW1PQB0_9FLAO